MTNNVNEAAIVDGSLATPGVSERTLLVLLAAQDMRNTQTRAQERRRP